MKKIKIVTCKHCGKKMDRSNAIYLGKKQGWVCIECGQP